jgi:RHS repeat-associated protein
MAGISDKAAGGLENKKKYNGIEFDNDLDLNEYEANLRDLDPQTGRWWQIDPETEGQEVWSPYTSNNDNPILYKDPRGNEGEACCGGGILSPITLHDMNKAAYFFNEYINPVTPIVEFITGSHESGFTAPKSRMQSAKEAALNIVPAGEEGRAALRLGEKVTAKLDESAVVSTEKSAENISKDLNGGKARVTLRSEKEMLRVDLTGKPHNGIETPHTVVAKRNYGAPNQPTYNTSQKLIEIHKTTAKELRMIRNYFKNNK